MLAPVLAMAGPQHPTEVKIIQVNYKWTMVIMGPLKKSVVLRELVNGDNGRSTCRVLVHYTYIV